MKNKIVYKCNVCSFVSLKWLGKCSQCDSWSSFEETIENTHESDPKTLWKIDKNCFPDTENKPLKIQNIPVSSQQRVKTNVKELDRTLGGGIVQGSVILLGGEPGIGKSTLLLQMALQLQKPVLYVSGEESMQQIKLRAQRIEQKNKDCFIFIETDTRKIFEQIQHIQPLVVIIDSIQTLHSNLLESIQGSLLQLRTCASELIYLAKKTSIPIFLIGHITKGGEIAGPKILEHMVDTVLQFEGDRTHNYRLLRTIKNRFGSTSELGVFEMTEKGLMEIENPSQTFMSERNENSSGNAVGTTLQGNRVLIVEIQSLVCTTSYNIAQRNCNGFDVKRLNMLLAVLEKKLGIPTAKCDVFLNITGGLKIEDPAIDLPICMAIISSIYEKPIPFSYCFSGEIGLGSEIRSINQVDKRYMEVEKLSFKRFFIPMKNSNHPFFKKSKITCTPISNLKSIIDILFK